MTHDHRPMTKRYHLIVIGAGSAGLVAAAGAAGLGARVALIEKNKMGGDCLNTGCVPSKAIIRTAKLAYDMRTATRFGLSNVSVAAALDKVLASVRKTQAELAHHDSVERFTALGVDVYRDAFRFTAPDTISNGKDTLAAKRFVIATGGSPAVPPVKGIEQAPYVTSDTVWELTELPKRFLVLGGGPIGCELAQVFARLGSRVTLLQRAKQLLPREDPDVGRHLQDRFIRENIHVLTEYETQQIQSADNGFELIGKTRSGKPSRHPFDKILVAAGRKPNVDGLDLDKAGVKFTRRGIVVDNTLRTTNRKIFACGDVIGSYLFTHTADFQARLILRNALFPGRSRIHYRVVPWCTFTDPEVARVGLNESQARAQNVAFDKYIYEFRDLDRAVCDRESEGFIKLLTKKGTDKILGFTIVGPHAGDLMHELTLAMHQKIGLKKISQMIHVYPTMAEMAKRVADTYQRTRLTPQLKRWLRRYFCWRFG